MAKARKGPKPSESPTAEELTELAELVLNPLKMIREAVFRNKVIILSPRRPTNPKYCAQWQKTPLAKRELSFQSK